MKYTRSPLLILGLVCACGDGGSAGSGVAADKSVIDVTLEEARSVCKWEEAQWYRASIAEFCTLDAAIERSDQASCEADRKRCIDIANMEEMESANDDPDESEQDYEPCSDDEDLELNRVNDKCEELTVGEYEACVRALSSVEREVYQQTSCEDAERLTDDLEDEMYPTECDVVRTKCRDLLP